MPSSSAERLAAQHDEHFVRLVPVMALAAFYQLYRGLQREGPGEAADVAWAIAQGGVKPDAMICDVACGSGADIAPLLAACPTGQVVALDRQAHFIDEAQARCGDDPRIDLRVGDMGDIGGRYDFIWCAGAVYFLGITQALKLWRSALAAGSIIAFSEPCWWVNTPSKQARDLWADYGAMSDAAGIAARIEAAGFQTLATRRLADRAWDGYYASLQTRIDLLRVDAGPELTVVLNDCANEIAVWRRHSDEYGYLLSVVQPK